MSESKQPHDRLFKTVFSKRKVMLDYIRQFLPKKIWKEFDLRTLKLSSTSGVDKKLKEHVSDLVYTCLWNKTEHVRICLLLEHKSYPEKYPRIQLLRYMLNIWEKDLEDNKVPKPIIPIVFYHGKQKWKSKAFSASFGKAGKVFEQFIPQFDYHLTDLSEFSDDFILNLKRGFLVNSLLLMKHKNDQDLCF